MQAPGDLVRLSLRTRRGSMSREIARRRDQRQRGLACAPELLVLTHGCFHALDGVEVAVLAQQTGAEHRDEPIGLAPS